MLRTTEKQINGAARLTHNINTNQMGTNATTAPASVLAISFSIAASRKRLKCNANG